MTSEVLKPCPFCGGEATVERIGKSGYFYVACNMAFCCDFGKFDTEAEAIAAWNTRTELGSGTCENIAPDYLDFLCSKCGFVHYHSDENDTGDGNDWNYCPNCGRKVVSE